MMLNICRLCMSIRKLERSRIHRSTTTFWVASTLKEPSIRVFSFRSFMHTCVTTSNPPVHVSRFVRLSSPVGLCQSIRRAVTVRLSSGPSMAVRMSVRMSVRAGPQVR